MLFCRRINGALRLGLALMNVLLECCNWQLYCLTVHYGFCKQTLRSAVGIRSIIFFFFSYQVAVAPHRSPFEEFGLYTCRESNFGWGKKVHVCFSFRGNLFLSGWGATEMTIINFLKFLKYICLTFI